MVIKVCISVADPCVCAPCRAVMDVIDDDVSSPRFGIVPVKYSGGEEHG
jgi:hypothetical protein